MTETALTTALNASYMAEQMANFGILVGIALLLSGFGVAILAIGGALRNPLGLRLSHGPTDAKALLRCRWSRPDSTLAFQLASSSPCPIA